MKNNSYIEDNKYIGENLTKPINKIQTKSTNYKGKSVLDTSSYKKYEGLRVEKWTLLLR